MYKPNKPGFHTKLTPQVNKIIVECVPKVLGINQVAALAGILPETLKDWLKRGKEDALKDENTIYAQLSLEIGQKKAKCIAEYLEQLKSQNSYQSITWILEHCVPEEFSANSDMIKELIKNVEILVNVNKAP